MKAVNNTIRSDEKFISRIKQRLENLLVSGFPYFITFTIKPEYDGISSENLVRSIKKALGGAVGYLFNEDYGKENCRLHFHAVASFAEQLNYTTILEKYKYGSVNFKPVIIKKEKALREYLLKTTLHATKKTTGTIYRSRRKNDV